MGMLTRSAPSAPTCAPARWSTRPAGGWPAWTATRSAAGVHGDAEILPRRPRTGSCYDADRRRRRVPASATRSRRSATGRRVHLRERRHRDASTWWSAPTGCTRACAGWPSAPRASSCATSATTSSIFAVPNHLGLDREELTYVGPGRTALVYSTAGAGRREGDVPVRRRRRGDGRRDRAGSSRLPRRRRTRRGLGGAAAARRDGAARRLLLRLDQPGPHRPLVHAAGSRWSATPPTAPRPPPARAPASRWSARTCWPASWRGRRRPRRRPRGVRAADAPLRRAQPEARPGQHQADGAAQPAVRCGCRC